MKTLSSLGIGLSLVSGFLLLALVAELYYLFWWKTRIPKRDIEYDYTTATTTPASNPLLFCWKKRPPLSSTALDPQDSIDERPHEFHPNTSKDVFLKPFEGEETMETELMRLHGLSGPPRILFTIAEETKEDLESEDGRSRGGNFTPLMTPLSSPHLTPLDCYSQRGLNPLFESFKEEDFCNKWRSASPPPKFKFLKDAEEKLYRKTLVEEALEHQQHHSEEDKDGPFITIIIGKNKERGNHHHSSSSQVIPLASSPSSIRDSHGNPNSNLGFKG